MKALIDTNVIIDVLCKREPFYEDSLSVFECCEYKTVSGYISALTVMNTVYIMRKDLNTEKIVDILSRLLDVFMILDLKTIDLVRALELNFKDYEDGVQCFSAVKVNADYIITRNTKDFKDSPIPAVTPAEFIEIVGK